jgi:multidrug efflux pump
MSIVLIILGGLSYTFLGVREYPNVDPPIITVSTNYIGANAEVIESQITEPLEESINGIAGIRTMTSTSRDGRSTINVEFDIGIDLDNAANDVRDRVSRSLWKLPQNIEPPSVSKADADANPIIFVNLKSKTKNLLELTDIATNLVKERLQTIPGVSEINIWGEKKYSMRLWMDPLKMNSYNITPMDIRNAVLRENLELPTGRFEGQFTDLSLRTIGRINSVDEFNNLIIKEEKGTLIKFSDVGYADLYPENDRTILKRDGVPMVGCVILPQAGSNHIDISDNFYKRYDDIKKELPQDVTSEIGFDNTMYIRESIAEVEQTIIVAFLLVIFIIFFFLRDWKTTIIPILAIPISLISAFFIMYLAGYTINVLTLLGIVLAIGIVVDDAIVMLENIYRRIEDGEPPIKAGIEGAKEIFFAIIATTAALVVVFFPILFIQGLTGRLFREFGIVLAGSIVVSAFVALTLTPMISTRILAGKKGHGKFYNMTEPFFVGLMEYYRKSLLWFMKRRYLTLPVIIASFAIIYFAGKSLPSELAPIEDRGAMRLSITAPEGTGFAYMNNYVDEIVKVVADTVPEARTLISVASPGFGSSSSVNSGFTRIFLIDKNESRRSQQEIGDQLSDIFAKYSDARIFVIQEQSIGSNRGGLPVQYVLQAQSLDKLKKVLPKFLLKARQNPAFKVVDVDMKFNKPELSMEIQREKARELGVSVADIAQTLQLSLSGQRYDYFIKSGKLFQIIGQLPKIYRSVPDNLRLLYVRSSNGNLVSLDDLVSLKETSVPPQLYRYNRYVSATISASLIPGYTIGSGLEEMDRIAATTLDETVYTALSGPSKDFKESSSNLLFVFLLALVLIYLVLAAQFESFRDPFIIMFTVPLALTGALFSLYIFDQTLNIFSQIGLIMLIGIVTKNGILIVEFANQIRRRGKDKFDSVIESATLRFRPILMTSLSTILGTLPIALALGAGSESRVSMGIAIIGGLILSTLLTLYIVPAIYTYLTPKNLKNQKEDSL